MRPQQQPRQQQTPAQPAYGGGSGGQYKEWKCKIQGCRDNNQHSWPECFIFRSLSIGQRWALVSQHKYCELCLKHVAREGGRCFMSEKNGGPAPCGESGCPLLHHPVLLNQVQGGHGGGVFPHWQMWQVVKRQASMVEQQSKEDVGIGDMHAQDNVTFSSSGHPIGKNGETIPIFSGKKVTAPALAPKDNAAENCALNANCEKSMQSKASSDPHISARTGSDEYGSGSDTESYKSADFYDTDEELGNIAASSESNIVMLGHTVSIGNKNVNLCYDSGAAFSVIHENVADPMYICEHSIRSLKSMFDEIAVTEKFPIVNIPMSLSGGGVGAIKAHEGCEGGPPPYGHIPPPPPRGSQSLGDTQQGNGSERGWGCTADFRARYWPVVSSPHLC
jgi:hypothetical protein